MSDHAGISVPEPSAVREQSGAPSGAGERGDRSRRAMRFPDLRPRAARRGGWIALLIAAGATLGLAFVPSPYVLETPGPTFDTLGETDAGPLITVHDAETFPTDGELRLVTVSLHGSPDRPLSWAEVAAAYLDPADALLPMEAVYPTTESVEESNEAAQIDMRNSQSAAIAAALLHEGYEVESDVRVAGVIEDLPADGVLEEGDRILRVNGDVAYDVWSIRASIARSVGPTSFTIERDGQERTVELTPVLEDDQPIVGIYPSNEFTFPIAVDIELPNVGGPSAGMMFALGIVDELTPGPIAGGSVWAGTGTISALGDVGPIGGIVQKMHGAQDAGATHFLAPVENCGEVVGHVPDGLDVFAVDTLDDAIAALDAVREGDASGIPTCEAALAAAP